MQCRPATRPTFFVDRRCPCEGKVAAGDRERKKEAGMRTLAIMPFGLMLALAVPAAAQQQND
ncbi:hypothetical protein EN938_23210, partial [Mesorhizobium sp. M7A.F.Ca.US.001.02.1.1]